MLLLMDQECRAMGADGKTIRGEIADKRALAIPEESEKFAHHRACALRPVSVESQSARALHLHHRTHATTPRGKKEIPVSAAHGD